MRNGTTLKALFKTNCAALAMNCAKLAQMPTRSGFALVLNAEWLSAIKTIAQMQLTVLRLALATRCTSSLFSRIATDASWNALTTLWVNHVDNMVCPKTVANSW